jgi:hypothetical protein
MKKGAEGKRKENKHNENAIWGVLSTDWFHDQLGRSWRPLTLKTSHNGQEE